LKRNSNVHFSQYYGGDYCISFVNGGIRKRITIKYRGNTNVIF